MKKQLLLSSLCLLLFTTFSCSKKDDATPELGPEPGLWFKMARATAPLYGIGEDKTFTLMEGAADVPTLRIGEITQTMIDEVTVNLGRFEKGNYEGVIDYRATVQSPAAGKVWAYTITMLAPNELLFTITNLVFGNVETENQIIFSVKVRNK